MLIVDDSIFSLYHECVVCPTKATKMFLYDGKDRLIYSKAGLKELSNLYCINNSEDSNFLVPFITSGVSLSKDIMHILTPPMNNFADFEIDIYKAYKRVFEMIKEKKYKTVVFPPIPYGNLRTGTMNSLRTCLAMTSVFLNRLHIDSHIVIATDKKTVLDNLQDYHSSYVSTSFPVSKRHKKHNYTLITIEQVMNYFNRDLEVEKDLLTVQKVDEKSQEIYNDIITNYESIEMFGVIKYVNSKLVFQFFDGLYSRDSLLSILYCLNYDLEKVNSYLNKYKFQILDEVNPRDKLIIELIQKENNRNLVKLNQQLFVNDLYQLER